MLRDVARRIADLTWKRRPAKTLERVMLPDPVRPPEPVAEVPPAPEPVPESVPEPAPPPFPLAAELDRLLLCAFYLWGSREPGRTYRVTVVTDEPGRYPADECRRVLKPWADWVEVAGHAVTDPDGHGWEPPADGPVLAVVKDREVLAAVVRRCADAGVRVVESIHPPGGVPDHDLYREVCHFDFEFGGVHEWDGRPTAYGPEMLRLLSASQCRRVYPGWAFDGLPRRAGPWRVIDIGCGPVSLLRWGALRGDLVITGVDPLLELYALVRARHGYDALPEIACAVEIPAVAERLDELVPDAAYDVIYTQNALDHTQEPRRVVDHFARKLVPGGRVVVQVATNEGTRQNWDQFHKTDIDVRDGVLVYRHQHTAEGPLLPPGCGLRLAKVHSYTADWLAVVLERE